MAVPEEIRSVERPKNTVVVDNGGTGAKRYAVRERGCIKYVRNGNPQPSNGKTIGYIVNGVFVPARDKIAKNGPEALSYGAAAFAYSVSKDILKNLLDVFCINEAHSIIAAATLKVIKPSVSSSRMKSTHERCFTSIYYPNAALSQNSILSLYKRLGQDGPKRREFYDLRVKAVCEEHHIAVDGTLKQNTSIVNDLSSFSYKSRVKGVKDISILYAYDIEKKEPLCAQVFPGNSIDASSYASFIRDNGIKKGILIDDKGFPPSKIRKELESNPELHYLTPIKRNDKRIATFSMLNYEGVLDGVEGNISYKKCKIKEGMYLYAYRDSKKASGEERAYIEKAKSNQDYNHTDYVDASKKFGVIVFESDLDISPRDAYLWYGERWLLELAFKRYKSDEGLTATRVQGDYSVIGSEFVNCIATLITCRMVKIATDTGLLKEDSFGDILDDLSSCWRMANAPTSANSDDKYWVHTLDIVFDKLEKLGLSIPAPKTEKKRKGRPRKERPVEDKPKRPRGRPRKNPLP